jgi:hypothetical protein
MICHGRPHRWTLSLEAPCVTGIREVARTGSVRRVVEERNQATGKNPEQIEGESTTRRAPKEVLR